MFVCAGRCAIAERARWLLIELVSLLVYQEDKKKKFIKRKKNR